MSGDRVLLKDEKLLALYSALQKMRRRVGELCPQARYFDFVDKARYEGRAILAAMLAQHHMLDITNTLNRFHYDVHTAEAWRLVLACVSESERMQAHFEFVFPLISYTFSLPYSIKQKIVSSTYQLLFHTRGMAARTQPNPRANFSDAQKLARDFRTWPVLSDSLAALDDEGFRNSSENYRNNFHHGFPVSIEFGHIMTISHEGRGQYSLRSLPPLRLDDVTPILLDEYKTALHYYFAYVELVKEQEFSWRC